MLRLSLLAALVSLAAAEMTVHDLHEALSAFKAESEMIEITGAAEVKLVVMKDPIPGGDPQPQEALVWLSADGIHFKSTWTTPNDGLFDFPTVNNWNAAYGFARVSLVMNDDGSATFIVMQMDQMLDTRQVTRVFFHAFVGNALSIFKNSVQHFDQEFMNAVIVNAAHVE
ncbi:hypothetical protein DIPPA_27183 [Diplonema papillatum]|nr:hypothetical protein DIPPA_27183 [Diplonema papillatum]